jgi:hypothetical protein
MVRATRDTRVPAGGRRRSILGSDTKPVIVVPYYRLEFTPHEADPKGRFTTDNAREMGASGAAKREERWQDRVSTTRQELAAHTDLAIERLRAILETGRHADALRAAIAPAIGSERGHTRCRT